MVSGLIARPCGRRFVLPTAGVSQHAVDPPTDGRRMPIGGRMGGGMPPLWSVITRMASIESYSSRALRPAPFDTHKTRHAAKNGAILARRLPSEHAAIAGDTSGGSHA